jgi:hypothetical protein
MPVPVELENVPAMQILHDEKPVNPAMPLAVVMKGGAVVVAAAVLMLSIVLKGAAVLINGVLLPFAVSLKSAAVLMNGAVLLFDAVLLCVELVELL